MEKMKSDMVYSDEQWISWMDQLAEQDYVVVDDFISEEMYQKIMEFFESVESDDKLKKAGIGS